MMRGCLAAGAALILMLAAPVTAQEGELLLGEDPAGDDTVGPIGSGGLGYETSNIDDIRALHVWSVEDAVKFRVTVEETASSTTHGQFCWMPAFEVQGQEVEYVALMCETYTAGSPDGFFADDTNRGEEVASEAEWDGTSVVITVPFANIGASAGDVLEDIYVLTYGPSQGQNGLYVDDTLPDAKSDRNAAENLGCYVLGGGDASALTCEAPPPADGVAEAVTHHDMLPDDGIALSFTNGTSDTYVYNWTADGTFTVHHDVTVTQGNATIALLDGNGTSLFEAVVAEDSNGTTPPLDLPDDAYSVTIAFQGFIGNLSIDIAPVEQDADAPASDEETAGDDEASPGDDGEAPAEGDDGEDLSSTEGDGKESPGLAVWALLTAIVALAARRR